VGPVDLREVSFVSDRFLASRASFEGHGDDVPEFEAENECIEALRFKSMATLQLDEPAIGLEFSSEDNFSKDWVVWLANPAQVWAVLIA